MRRVLLVSLIAPALLAAGCGGNPTGDVAKRTAFLERHGKVKDYDLAGFCPGLYPRDYRSEPDKYNYKRPSKPFTATARQRADARATPGCRGPGTKPD